MKCKNSHVMEKQHGTWRVCKSFVLQLSASHIRFVECAFIVILQAKKIPAD